MTPLLVLLLLVGTGLTVGFLVAKTEPPWWVCVLAVALLVAVWLVWERIN